jgi:O-Antigen ligase
MKRFIAQLKHCIPDSTFGKKVSLLIGLLFLILPFQTPILHKTFKKLSVSILPPDLPAYFPNKIAFFPSEFLLLILLFFFRKHLAPFFWSGPSKYLTLLFSTALLSLALSSHSTYPLLYTRFLEMALPILVFNAIRTAFDAKSILPFIRFLAWILFFLSLFECVVAMAQFYSQSSIGLKSIGECDLSAYSFPMQGAHRWIFDADKAKDVLIRVSGTFPHPNIFGGFLFCSLLSTLYLFFTDARRKWIVCVLFLQIPVIILTFSRAAMIAFGVTVVMYLFLQIKTAATRKLALGLTLALIGLGGLCFSLFYPQLTARGGIINYNQLVQGADSERIAYQKIAIEMIKEHPLLGIGLNAFQIESPRYETHGKTLPSRVHNIYLLIAAETGLIGAACFFLFLISLLRHARSALHTQEGQFLVLLFCGLLFIGCCDFYLLCTPFGQMLFFGAAGLYHSISSKFYAYAQASGYS